MTQLTVAEVLHTSNGRTSAEDLTTSAGTTAGDTLLIAYGSDFFQLANMPDPTSTAGDVGEPVYALDVGTNKGHIKVYLVAVEAGGAQTVTIPAHNGCDIFGVVLRLTTATTVDDVDGNSDPTESQTAHVAPSADVLGADRLLVGIWLCFNVNTGFPSPPYVEPPGMTVAAMPSSSPFSVLLVATDRF